MQTIFESIFSITYLISVITLGIIMLKNSKSKEVKLYGIMSITLGAGDAFHLIPRIYANLTNTFDIQATVNYLGFGKFVTSISMTIFYVLLFIIWQLAFDKKSSKLLRNTIFVLAAIRIILCFMPQNEWLSMNPSLTWGIIRNIPFLIMGIMIMVVYFKQSKKHVDNKYKFVALAVLLSFLFYIPVVLFASTYSWVGILMIPKTVAYFWIVLIGFKYYKKEIQKA